MKALELTKDQISSLEEHTYSALNALEFALKSGKKRDYNWAHNQYYNIGKTINDVIESFDKKYNIKKDFLNWDRTHKKSKILDKYILQHIIGRKFTHNLWKGDKFDESTKKFKKKKISKAEALIKKTTNHYCLNISYEKIEEAADLLSQSEKYDILYNSLEKINNRLKIL